MSRRLFLPLLAIASLGCGGKPTPDTTPEPPPAPPPTTAAKLSADPSAPSADRTFDYWAGVAKIQELTARRYAALADPEPDEVHKLLTDAARGIDDLPTEKVDADAVAVGKSLSETLRRFANKSSNETPLFAFLTEAAGRARSAKAAVAAKYGREFADLTSAAKEPMFRIARDLGRPTLAQELARLKGEMAQLDKEIKPISQQLTDEITTKDKLQGEADSVRAILKEQTEDADLKKLRQEVLDDAVKQVEAQKKVIDKLTKEVNALRAKKSELDRLALEVSGVLIEGEPEKAETLPLDRLDRLRVLADRMTDKIDARKK